MDRDPLDAASTHRWHDWVHVTCSCRGRWLPGDARGFRDHNHRVHSSGNYRDFPPLHEHAGLRVYAVKLSKGTVSFSIPQRAIIGVAMLEKLEAMSISVRVLAVAATHVHALLRVGKLDAVAIFGRAKQLASHRLRSEMPGTIWGEGSHPERIAGEEHYQQAVDYICRHRLDGAWLWDAYGEDDELQ